LPGCRRGGLIAAKMGVFKFFLAAEIYFTPCLGQIVAAVVVRMSFDVIDAEEFQKLKTRLMKFVG
jgi:hypothetical protein